MKRVLALISVALVASLAVPGTTIAKECKSYKITGASKPHKSRSLRAFPGSLVGWKRNVRHELGFEWSLWIRAEDKTIDCNQLRSGPNAGKWRCVRSARPCSGALGPEEEEEMACVERVESYGAPRYSRSEARDQARWGWTIDTRRSVGVEYADWDRAADPDISCRSLGDRIQCIASGRPCAS